MESPRVGVAAVVVEGGRVLAVRRRRDPAALEWAFPGGAVEFGETLANAAIRETLEETGVRIRVLDRLEVVERIDSPPGAAPAHWVLVVYAAVPADRPAAAKASAGDDALAVEWLTVEELSSRPAVPGVADLARRAINLFEDLASSAINLSEDRTRTAE